MDFNNPFVIFLFKFSLNFSYLIYPVKLNEILPWQFAEIKANKNLFKVAVPSFYKCVMMALYGFWGREKAPPQKKKVNSY